VSFTEDNVTDIAIANAKRLKARSKKLNITLLTSHILIGVLIVGIVALGYRAPVEATGTTNDRAILDQPTVSVDQIAAANVATDVAQTADLAVQTNVSSLSASLSTKTALAQTDNAFLNKPQIVSQIGRKGITKYTAVAGDTVQKVAAKYGISEDTVRWANNLTSDSLTPGQQLSILGTTGIIYTAKAGDNAAQLADKYKADKDRIITFNDLELTGLNAGQQIVIPDGVLPENERPGYVAPRSLRSYASPVVASHITIYGGNGYAYGYCTYYAYNRRMEIGRPIGGNWGNAVTWAAYAAAAGFRVDHTPEVGAVMQNGGGYGHVAVVERIDSDGSVTVSEMNYAGWNIISSRTISASQAGGYNYIH
jgi:N-acetylmuramoyl-L-alanine amidase